MKQTSSDLIMRLLKGLLDLLSIDASGRLRVAAESAVVTSGTITTVTTVTTAGTLTNLGAGYPGTSMQETLSDQDYQQGFRNHLAVS